MFGNDNLALLQCSRVLSAAKEGKKEFINQKIVKFAWQANVSSEKHDSLLFSYLSSQL